jgi:hypothetical protein
MHMHHVLRSQGITFHELGHQGREAALASLEAQGFSQEEASTELSHRGRDGALASLEAQGFTGEGVASTELGHRGRDGALASLETQGFTGEGAASTELACRGGEARWGGEARLAINRSGNCIYSGCPFAISSGEFCVTHNPPKEEKSDKCRVCRRVLGMEKRVRGGVCNACYCKPEAKAARKKATTEKKAARGTCSTPSCNGVNIRGRSKCDSCLYPRKF